MSMFNVACVYIIWGRTLRIGKPVKGLISGDD